MAAWTIQTCNGAALAADAVPVLAGEAFRQAIVDAAAQGKRISALFGSPLADGRVRLYVALADDASGSIEMAACDVKDSYPALTVVCPQAHWFEREIAEQWGIVPVGHPWLKPIRFHNSYLAGKDAWGRDGRNPPTPSVTNFFQMQGAEVHEVAVGPVHAGIIEPGHFRFQCHGENVYHLEISLGYQHRGIERAMMAADANRLRFIHYMETAAGDTTIGHAIAYCQVLEAISHCYIPPRAMALRGIALELERIANHVGDLGAMAGDIGFLPTMSYCGRLRGDLLNLTALICGNRFGRGIVRPGGVGFDVDAETVGLMSRRLRKAAGELVSAVTILWDAPSVTARMEDVGAVSIEMCDAIGLVGPAARGCGCERDVRKDHPTGIYSFAHLPVTTWPSGDVFARAQVRWMEIQRSIMFIEEQLDSLPGGPVSVEVAPVAPDQMAVSMVEGWRGEICHVAITGAAGGFARYKIVDPSFHNWFGLALALRGQQISDFPLCNKSFNLSYCGHDL